MLQYVDTHCHLGFRDFDDDRSDTITRANANGVGTIIIPSIDLQDYHTISDLEINSTSIYQTVGVHPNSAVDWTAKTKIKLTKIVVEAKVVGIGEIGLDYYRDRVPRDLQVKVFQDQLDIALEYQLPVIIHCRDAAVDMVPILEAWMGEMISVSSPLTRNPGVFHAFQGNHELLRIANSLGFFIGIGGPITYTNSQQLQDAVVSLPIGKILLETDSPFLPPQKYRGKRNEPAYIIHIAEAVARLKNISVEEVSSYTTKNAIKLFNLKN